MIEKLVRGVGRKVGVSLVLGRVRAAAEGRLGPEWKARYWGMVGRKTWTAMGLGLVAALAAWFGYDQMGVWVGVAAGLLMQAGLLDKAWRGQLPAALAESPAYRLLAQHSADLATVSGLLAARFAQCGHECDVYAWGLAGVTAALAELALLDPAARAKPPARPPSPVLDRVA